MVNKQANKIEGLLVVLKSFSKSGTSNAYERLYSTLA